MYKTRNWYEQMCVQSGGREPQVLRALIITLSAPGPLRDCIGPCPQRRDSPTGKMITTNIQWQNNMREQMFLPRGSGWSQLKLCSSSEKGQVVDPKRARPTYPGSRTGESAYFCALMPSLCLRLCPSPTRGAPAPCSGLPLGSCLKCLPLARAVPGHKYHRCPGLAASFPRPSLHDNMHLPIVDIEGKSHSHVACNSRDWFVLSLANYLLHSLSFQ